MVNISSAMGSQFAVSATEMVNEITKIGPNPLKLNGAETNVDLECES
jgi:coenzyme F420-reducing hydrogenase delta subunit